MATKPLAMHPVNKQPSFSFTERLLASAKQEWRFLAASPWDRSLVSWLPLGCLLLFAAMFFSSQPTQLPLAVVDNQPSATSRQLLHNLSASPYLKLASQPSSLKEAWQQVRSMQVNAVLYLPPKLEETLAQGETAPVFAYFNASFTTAGSAALQAIEEAVSATSASLAVTPLAKNLALTSYQPAPIQAQVNLLFNPAKNFEFYLLGILMPGVLVLLLALAVTASLGREFNLTTANSWAKKPCTLASSRQYSAAILGKLLVYFVLFSGYALAILVWVAYIRGEGVAGSLFRLVLGNFLLCLAYIAWPLFLVGLTQRLADAYSAIGLTVGTAIAFTGATFPINGAPLVAKVWHYLVPLTHYLQLDVAERYVGSPWQLGLGYLAILAGFSLLIGLLGLVLLQRRLIKNLTKQQALQAKAVNHA